MSQPKTEQDLLGVEHIALARHIEQAEQQPKIRSEAIGHRISHQ